MSVFLTGPLELKNQYEDDQVLQHFLKENISSQSFEYITTDLIRFGERVISDILEVAEQAEKETPLIEGDELILSQAWRKLHDISAEEGLISIGYQENLEQMLEYINLQKNIFLTLVQLISPALWR